MLRLTIASPCDVPWDEMARRLGGRHCAHCDKRVHDLTAVTEVRARALSLLLGATGMCARIRSDADGNAIWKSEPHAKNGGRARLLAAAVTLAAPIGCGGAPPPSPSPVLGHAEPSPAMPAEPAGAARARARAPVIAPADTDGDGVPDSADKCPREAGPADNDGCPRIGIVNSGVVEIVERPHFAIQSTTVPAEARPILDEVARLLKVNPDIKLVHVIGHTDSSEASPEKLSLVRAKAVVDYLVKAGVDPSRLSAEGKGSSQPIEPNMTRDGRAENRRVDFRIDEPPTTAIP